MMSFWLGMLVTLLPAQLRQRWLRGGQADLRASAILCGILQMLVAGGTLLLRYSGFVRSQMEQIRTPDMLRAAEKGGETAVAGLGVVFLFAYLLTPLSILLIYCTLEGVVRVVAAATTGEAVGTLPLLLADIAWQKWSDRRMEHLQGPRVPDRVTPAPEGSGDFELEVASCRAKPNWDHLVTISYDDQLYEVADYAEGSAPRRHVYRLRKAPAHKIVRGVHHYDPNEVMGQKPLAIGNQVTP